MKDVLLEVKNASFSYKGGRIIFHDVNLSLHKGEIFTILGPNGAGKSTLLNSIVRLLKLNEGEILLNGKTITSMRERDIAKMIAYVSQSSMSTFDYSVREYIVMGRAAHIGIFGKPGKEDYAIADAIIEKMNIQHLSQKLYMQISGGERQQACVARALVQQPEIIIFDEPTSALDYGNQLKTLALIRELSEHGYGVIMTTHNPDHVILLGGTAGILDRGGRMKSGPAEEMLDETYLSELYRANLKLVYVDDVKRKACLAMRF
ncbi:ABC transporter ATP-binding protein [Anaerovorax odorimutans]|uniref:ABC transporter ATP-binding protein n=1 Tax=Anaerovorax odorimutans TaxID=109327 RepID=A0ABT1RPF8_9FIRM|nr:ABC transporter ATP-binding protein [Anaerovorax odorimutans]MCQ4637058.1 ABC transporter ATP-binding protein [Anaerovorax odorimutans]